MKKSKTNDRKHHKVEGEKIVSDVQVENVKGQGSHSMIREESVKISKGEQLEVWCICEDNDLGGRMISCDSNEKCESYHERLRTLNAVGGNWFHLSCLGLKKVPKSKWFCKLCRHSERLFPKVIRPKSVLKLILSKENRRLFDIKPDGNCLFSALSMDKFSNPALHVVMRERLCKKLHDIFVSEEFTGRWSYNTCPSGEALVQPEARFVGQFIHNFCYGIFPQNGEMMKKKCH